MIAEKKLAECDVEIDDKDDDDYYADLKDPNDLKDPDDLLPLLGKTSDWVELSSKEKLVLLIW